MSSERCRRHSLNVTVGSILKDQDGPRYFAAHASGLGCLYTAPSFMTKSTCSRTLMSRSGSAETALTSAYLPGLIEPTSFEWPRRSAAFVVAAWMACIGVIPYFTINA